jgi:SAM-dependent methyltransferase
MPILNVKLFGVSFVMLFLEILLIRWIATEIRIFAYLGNLVLLACFLGIGVGCFFSRKKINILITFGLIVLLVLSVRSEPFRNITDLLGGFSDSVIWYQAIRTQNLVPALQGTLLTLFIFLMILISFIPLGQLLGRLLDEHPQVVEGYSVNVGASLAGIWAFNIFALYYTKPWLWVLFSLIILFFFIPRSKANFFMAGMASVLILLVVGISNPNLLSLWSPYQKLDIYPNQVLGIRNGFMVNVNNVGYMTLLDLSDDFIKKYPSLYNLSLRKFSQYDLPYAFVEKRDAVLIVGAGGGNDVAGALRNGPKEIDAVEIDPGVLRLGLALHPERPYEQVRVKMILDDARAFFKKTNKKYDLISFGLLDSHTLSSNYNNTRLDHYVYTEESFREAGKLLKEDGVLSVIFATPTRWLGERIYGILKKNFGEVPYAFAVQSPGNAYGWGGIMFLTGKNIEALKKRVESNPDLKEWIFKHQVPFSGQVRLTTDDWPYLYIEKASVPRMHLLILSSLLVLFLAAQRFIFTTEGRKINFHFFFLGSAFLLLEFQNVSKTTLLFGSTWMVNSLIISSILLLILLSNLFVAYVKIRSRFPFYILLWFSVMVLYFVPLDIFNTFDFWTKTVLAGLFLDLPVFFAGIIYIHSFKEAPAKDLAFGSNLIGAAFGGLLESLSFVTGIKALLLVVLFFYVLSYLFLPKGKLKTVEGG